MHSSADTASTASRRHFADDAQRPGWEVVSARRSLEARVGVSMTGFRQCGRQRFDMVTRPLPAITVVLQLGSAALTVADAHELREMRNGVAGLVPSPAQVGGWDVDCVELRMSPIGAYTLLGGSSAQLEGQIISLDDVWGPDATRLCERLAAKQNWCERFSVVETALARKLESGPQPDPEVRGAWAQILASGGLIRVDELAAESGWSRKRLWSRFTAQVGITPKRSAKLVRFDAAARRLFAGEDPAATAAVCGYADQSHLHRDVWEFAGATPRGFVAAQRPASS